MTENHTAVGGEQKQEGGKGVNRCCNCGATDLGKSDCPKLTQLEKIEGPHDQDETGVNMWILGTHGPGSTRKFLMEKATPPNGQMPQSSRQQTAGGRKLLEAGNKLFWLGRREKWPP